MLLGVSIAAHCRTTRYTLDYTSLTDTQLATPCCQGS